MMEMIFEQKRQELRKQYLANKLNDINILIDNFLVERAKSSIKIICHLAYYHNAHKSRWIKFKEFFIKEK